MYILESANKFWDIIIVIVSGISISITTSFDLLLEELVLLRTNLLKDVWHHFFKTLCFGDSCHNQKILSH